MQGQDAEFSKRSRSRANESGGSGPSRVAVTSAGMTKASELTCAENASTIFWMVSGVSVSTGA